MADHYETMKRLRSTLNRNVRDVLVLSDSKDPFYAGVPARRKSAEWFAGLSERFGFGVGTHVRRIHYRIISQTLPIPLPSGKPYENTEYCFKQLIWGARDARYLDLVPIESFIDQRNNETVIKRSDEVAKPAGLWTDGECDLNMPAAPELYLSLPIIPQRYHLEIIIEKSTVDDIVGPLADRFHLNFTSCVGEISLTRCFEIIQRAKASGLPVRILYLSDFDPGGESMPVACSRKLEFLIRDGDLDLDLQLRPVVLTKEQCEEYRLPRTPLKDEERRKAAFEARYGEGATELDALEALHPGVLRRILVDEITRYYDADLYSEIREAASQVEDEIEEVNETVHARFQAEHDALQAEVDALNDRILTYQGRVESDLRDLAPNVAIEWPQPAEGDDDPDPLFDSAREYAEQLDRYKRHQGKKVKERYKRKMAA